MGNDNKICASTTHKSHELLAVEETINIWNISNKGALKYGSYEVILPLFT